MAVKAALQGKRCIIAYAGTLLLPETSRPQGPWRPPIVVSDTHKRGATHSIIRHHLRSA